MKILHVEDHKILSDAMRPWLERFGDGCQVLCAESLRSAKAVLSVNKDVELVILDLELADACGSIGVSELCKHYPNVAIVVHSGWCDAELIQNCFDEGVRGYICKDHGASDFMSQLKSIMSNNSPVIPKAQSFRSTRPASPFANSIERLWIRCQSLNITSRQFLVLKNLSEGLTNLEIAKRLNISTSTVKTHLFGCYRALRARNRLEALRIFRDLE